MSKQKNYPQCFRCFLFIRWQIRVGVNYCSLNVIDVHHMGQRNDDIILPMIPGSEFSGEILEVGSNCKRNFKPGDKIASLLGMLSRQLRNSDIDFEYLVD